MKKYNYGVASLKVLMCFEVICAHFLRMDDSNLVSRVFFYISQLAVPIFMTISFKFFTTTLKSLNFKKIKKRMKKLVIPQLNWTIIYYLFYLTLWVMFKEKIRIEIFFWQLLTGHSLMNPTMWFQINLIIFSVFFCTLIYFCTSRMLKYILIILGIIALIFQYTEINFIIFGSLRYEPKYTLGRLCEMYPYMLLGYFIEEFKMIEKIRNRSIIIGLLIIWSVFFFLFKVNNLKFISDFGYSGILLIIGTILIVILAFSFPMESINSKRIKIFFNFTFGIYCMHRLVGNSLIIIFNKLDYRINSFVLCILIYIICYFSSLILSKFLPKFSKYLVE